MEAIFLFLRSEQFKAKKDNDNNGEEKKNLRQ